MMVKIGFDLDGVLVDQTKMKVEKFKELYNLSLERWQVTSNVIDFFVPDKTKRRNIGVLSGVHQHREFVESNTLEILTELTKQGNELYLISRRGKSQEGEEAGYEMIKKLGVGLLFNQRVFFCQTDEEKIDEINRIGLFAYIDDRFEVVDRLVDRVQLPILYDPFDLSSQGLISSELGYYIITTLKSVEKLVREGGSYEKRV